MKKLQDWMATWTVPEVIGVSMGMLCATAMAIVITVQDDWGKLVRWLAQPEAQMMLGGIAVWAATLYRRALKTPTTLLALALLGTLATGCGAQLTPAQRTTLATETQRCLINERAIVDRTGTSAEQDRADLATERARCDAARAAIVGTP